MQKRILAAGAAATLAFSAALPLFAGEEGVMVADPYARETPPNAQVGGAYMTLMNHGPATRLIGAQSEAAKAVQIHNHVIDDAGVMRMRQVEDGIALGMHETVVLQPGGLHVMLMGLNAPLKKGETVDITLDFEDGSTIDIVVPVKSISASGAMKHDHDTKHEHDMKHDDGGKTKHGH